MTSRTQCSLFSIDQWPADPGGELVWSGLVCIQAGDRVDGFGAEVFRLVQATSAAADLQCLGGVGEPDAGGDSQDFEGADLAAAVTTVGIAG